MNREGSGKLRRLGRYLLVERIGAGGMAEVYRAVALGARGFERRVVVKCLLPDLSASPEFVEMFVREARISALLDHPNLVQVHDFGQLEGRYFLAMEHLDGHTLLSVCEAAFRCGQLDPGVAIYAAAQVARGLAYVHSRTLPGGERLDLVHRDVTPSNIMLLRSGGVKLLDFGIVKAQAHFMGQDTTQRGIWKGKLSYMSPEQIDGKPADARSDIRSLGVVLWESLVGRSLFRGSNSIETVKNIKEQPVVGPSVLRPDVMPEVDKIVARALERDPGQRYADAGTMADELDGLLQWMGVRSSLAAACLEQLFPRGADEHTLAATPSSGLCWTADSEDGGGAAAAPGAGRMQRLRRSATWSAILLVAGLLLVVGSGASGARRVPQHPSGLPSHRRVPRSRRPPGSPSSRSRGPRLPSPRRGDTWWEPRG
jgi:serine/threonine-protein kinase